MVGFVHDGNIVYAGQHLLLDFYDIDCNASNTDILAILVKAAEATGATVLFSHLHPFDDGGVSAVVVLAESHLSMHLWSEERFAALDVFVCGQCNPMLAIPVLNDFFKPSRISETNNRRGIMKK